MFENIVNTVKIYYIIISILNNNYIRIYNIVWLTAVVFVWPGGTVNEDKSKISNSSKTTGTEKRKSSQNTKHCDRVWLKLKNFKYTGPFITISTFERKQEHQHVFLNLNRTRYCDKNIATTFSKSCTIVRGGGSRVSSNSCWALRYHFDVDEEKF